MDDVVGSRFKSQTGRGQMQDTGPSSTRAKALPPIENFSVPNVVVPGLDYADTVGAHTHGDPIPLAHGSKSRTVPGGPSKDFGSPNLRPSSLSVKAGKALGDTVLNHARSLAGRNETFGTSGGKK
jgi:hypothetical protein